MPSTRKPRAAKAAVTTPTPEEDVAITAGIAADPDAREWTDEDFAQARPAAEALPAAVLAAFEGARKRGRPIAANPKVKVMLRLDPDVVEAFRATGPGWQTRMNDALRAAAPKPPAA
ncbi:BrnA antitoxin family protein [Azospirillum sp. B4]|uniref:BrnA antitoxin family protein n=1 Tax=Azospirillum sp. B4 TaxID=95605 RepID=UPI00034AE8B9|nr:BrnA antitoxin family protein [Azospirillum sp. B4]